MPQSRILSCIVLPANTEEVPTATNHLIRCDSLRFASSPTTNVIVQQSSSVSEAHKTPHPPNSTTSVPQEQFLPSTQLLGAQGHIHMASFHPFPRLPYELRMRIWEMSVHPRTVQVDIRHWHKPDVPHWHKPAMEYITSSTPTPRVLQVCHEARNGGLYQKCFKELSHPRYGLQ